MKPKYYFTIQAVYRREQQQIEELRPCDLVIVFDDMQDFRENFAEVREQLLCDAEGYEWNQ